MINLLIWLTIVNVLAFSISKSKYFIPLRRKLSSLRENARHKLFTTYYLLYMLSRCSFCLSFWMGILILSWTAEPIKTIFKIDFFFNFILDGIFSLFLNIILLIIYGYLNILYWKIKNKYKKNG
jgi:hypothetical protein